MLYELALRVLEDVGNDVALSFRRDFPSKEQLLFKALEPAILPISSTVLNVGQTSLATGKIVQAVQESYLSQQWRQPYQVEDFGIEFFRHSAWFPIADVAGPLIYNQGLMEVMLLDSKLTYPSHKHTPEELYIVLAGQVWWEAENETACWKKAGEVIHHKPNIVHSIQAGDEPALILNLWRGGSFEMPVITTE